MKPAQMLPESPRADLSPPPLRLLPGVSDGPCRSCLRGLTSALLHCGPGLREFGGGTLASPPRADLSPPPLRPSCRPMARSVRRSSCLRGLTSALLHCGGGHSPLGRGLSSIGSRSISAESPRADLSPPPLRHHPRPAVRRRNRGLTSALLHGIATGGVRVLVEWTPRADLSPPPLRRTKLSGDPGGGVCAVLRGLTSALLHCGRLIVRSERCISVEVSTLRGLTSALLHCGFADRVPRSRSGMFPPPRADLSPPPLRRYADFCAKSCVSQAGAPRADLSPPPLRLTRRHTSDCWWFDAPRADLSPPPLRPVSDDREHGPGRGRLRGLTSALLHCGSVRSWPIIAPRIAHAPRADLSPPPLRPRSSEDPPVVCLERPLRGLTSALLHCGDEPLVPVAPSCPSSEG